MRLLLDTHAFLWWVEGSASLGRKATAAIADAEDQVFFSLASVWEMSIKISLGKLRLTSPLDRFLHEHIAANGFSYLPIQIEHAVRVSEMPFRHRDPFDRLIIAQALSEGLTVVSSDRVFRKYGVELLW